MSSLPEVITWITSEASPDDLERVRDAIQTRKAALTSIQAATLQNGDEVKTTGLSPKYLNGLHGVVTDTRASRVDVRLDKTSTERIIGTKYGPHWGYDSEKGFVLKGVPANCLNQTKEA